MLDMPDGLFQPVHHAHRDDGVEIFGRPIFFRRGLGGGKDRAHRLVAADFAAGLGQVFQNGQAMAFQDRRDPAAGFPPRRRSQVRRILAFSTTLRAMSRSALAWT